MLHSRQGGFAMRWSTSRLLIPFIVGAFLAFDFAPVTFAQEPILLRNNLWEITIQPDTLAVASKTPEGALLPISAAQESSAVGGLVTSEVQAHWELPAKQVSITMELADDA